MVSYQTLHEPAVPGIGTGGVMTRPDAISRDDLAARVRAIAPVRAALDRAEPR
jgi:hypothetical protein